MKPILFSTPMVQAIMDGRKTMTRRVVKLPLPDNYNVHRFDGVNEDGLYAFAWGVIVPGMCLDGGCEVKAPYKPGDVLWVKETWFDDGTGYGNIHYKERATEGDLNWFKEEGWKWRSPVTMPLAAARLFLRVTSVRAERVQDISTSDCEREGIASDIDRFNGLMTPHHDWIVGEFARLWDTINAKRGYGWDSNPFCWVVSFERIERPSV